MEAAFILIFLSFMSCGQTETANAKSSAEKEFIPFIRSEADRWSFENQMKIAMKSYMKKVENKTREILTARYLRLVWLPDYNLEFNSKTPDGESQRGTVHLKKGRCFDSSSINLAGDDIIVYENVSVTFTSDVKLWKKLECFHAFDVSTANHNYHGNISMEKNDIYYVLKVQLDFKTEKVTLLDIQHKCIGGSKLKIYDLTKDQQWLIDGISDSVDKLYMGGSTFVGIDSTFRTILEESIDIVDIYEHLPKLDYDINYRNESVSLKGVKLCGSGAGNGGELEMETDINLPFIKSEAEMWAFQNQIKAKLNEYVEHLANLSAAHVAERELSQAKLPANHGLFNAKDQSNTKRYGFLTLTNGWFLNFYKFVSNGIHHIQFRGKEVLFSAYVTLSSNLKFIHDFKANILSQEHKGKVMGRVNSLFYLLEFRANLETATVTLKSPSMDCIGMLSMEIVGLNDENSWILSGVENSVYQTFRNSILVEVHKMISQMFEYAVAETSLAEYLPKWNYARTIEMDLDMRIELDESDVTLCDIDTLIEATKKQEEFLRLMRPDGTYEEPSQNGTDDPPFAHVTRVIQQPVRFITLKSQAWYLEVQMRKKMNEYVYNLFKETSNVIQNQELGKAKIPSLTQPLIDEGSGNIFFKNIWIEDLSLIGSSGVDRIEYSQRTLKLSGKILLLHNVEFRSDYTATVVKKYESGGKLEGQMSSLLFSYAISVDYLKSRTVTLNSFQLDCIGRINVNFIGTGEEERSIAENIRESVEYALKHKVLEQVRSILHRSLEDAILSVRFEDFLPEFDYERDFPSEIVRHEKQNRFIDYLIICDSKEPSVPPFDSLYKLFFCMDPADEGTSPYADVLQEIHTQALRSSFQRHINALMLESINSIFDYMRNGSLQRFNPPKVQDVNAAFDATDNKGFPHRLSVTFINSWNDGVMTADQFHQGELVYGLNDTLNMLYVQKWKIFKVKYDFIVTDHTESNQVNGTIEARAENLIYFLKSRLGLHNKSFAVEEYFPYCTQGITMDVEGVSADYEWMMTGVRRQMEESFQKDVIPSVANLLYILLGYSADQFDAGWFLPPWICLEDLHDAAASEETNIQMTIDGINQCTVRKIDYKSSLIRGNVPFISSETEWWSFSRQTRIQMDIYTLNITKEASRFIRDNSLENATLPEAIRSFTAKDSGGREWEVNVTLTEGRAEDLSQMNHTEDYFIEFQGKELIVTTYVSFTQGLKLSYQFEANIAEKLVFGRVEGNVGLLTYELQARVDLMRKSTSIEKFDLLCLSGFEMAILGLDADQHWSEKGIYDASKEIFAGIISNDIRKIMRIAFGYGAVRVHVSDYLPDWNYDKDYGTTPEFERKKEFEVCTEEETSNKTAKTIDPDEVAADKFWAQIEEEAIFFSEW